MIRVETIKIEKFRGIRELTLNLKGKTFGICGPNGTGKSGIVDAIEFALTGDISRLSGRGTGDLSVKKHAPHVKERQTPKDAKVTMQVSIPSLGKSATIVRGVDSASTYKVTPDTPEVRAILDEIQKHPEFALSRRHIIQYVLSEPGKRSTDVQELLRLTEVDQARKAFTTVSNDARSQRDSAEQQVNYARTELAQAFGVQKADPDFLLTTVNAKRKVLALEPFEKLEAGTSFRDGIPKGEQAKQPSLTKSQTKVDLETVSNQPQQGESQDSKSKRERSREVLKSLVEDMATIRVLRQQDLAEMGIALLDEDKCPLCDHEWERDALHQHLTNKVNSAKEATKLIAELKTDLNQLIGELDAFASSLGRIVTIGGKLPAAPDIQSIKDYKITAENQAEKLREFVRNSGNPESALEALAFESWKFPDTVEKSLTDCLAAAEALPEISEEDQARDFLILAEERYRKAVDARSAFAAAKKRSGMASRALTIYEEQKDKILGGLYDDVAKDFTNFYRSLNQEDEGEFEGKLVPSAAKLGFDVDFYGYGKFPPGAYHSEGHQDGMGLCLYLALMKRTLNDKFTFAVLDDVLMSIDADHRRAVCKLLKREFPNTQFILTTHDRVWLKFMHTEGLIVGSQTFSGWTVETGPRVWDNRDVWQEIDDDLAKNDVAGAAATLRHFLEYMANMLADAFRAEVRFKGDGQYDLEDLMPPVLNRWRTKVNDSIKAAKSWGKDSEVTKLTDLAARVDDAYQRTQTERWALNPSVHYNAWANLQSGEFKTVVTAFSDVLATMRCPDCKTYVEFQPRHGSPQTIRCDCGTVFINLQKKDLKS
jgi:ABC-type dipeptide/oligopeptide/nickel transport system ATPase subunit